MSYLQQPTDLAGYNDYNSGYSTNNYDITPRKVNILEIVTVIISILALIVVFVWGFFGQNTKNRDSQRRWDITQMVAAITSFYENSSTVPSQRKFPIAECSDKLNEVDFEFTLRQYLTGKRIALDTHAYITDKNYPRDPWGVYSQNLNQRKVPLRDCPKLFVSLQKGGNQIYTDGYQSCNFQSIKNNYRSCYLYSSSVNGDTFQIGYYSESEQGFRAFKQFRTDDMTEEFVAV